jgi:hypothetical protein
MRVGVVGIRHSLRTIVPWYKKPPKVVVQLDSHN